jgi:hypothetical protein
MNAIREIEEFNAKLTLAITRSVGATAYASIQPTQAYRPLSSRIVGGAARISSADIVRPVHVRLSLIEFPADDPERARLFWSGLLGAQLEDRAVDEGRGWQAPSDAPTVGVHQRGTGPGDTLSLPDSPSLTSKRRWSGSERLADR